MQVTVHAAKTQLSRLIDAALAGEEVIIARGKDPVIRLTPIPRQPFKLDILPADTLGNCPDFLEPMDERALSDWENPA
ncbi:MAG: hypothetical protein Q4B17_02115 [Lautropia sp.]|nr:hypothetical protein [Lautropia sp.]